MISTPEDPQAATVGTTPSLAGLSAVVSRLEALAERMKEPRPLVVDAAGVARLLGCSKRHAERLKAAGELPDALVLGGGTKIVWRVSDIELFVRVGCDLARYRAAAARR